MITDKKSRLYARAHIYNEICCGMCLGFRKRHAQDTVVSCIGGRITTYSEIPCDKFEEREVTDGN